MEVEIGLIVLSFLIIINLVLNDDKYSYFILVKEKFDCVILINEVKVVGLIYINVS